MNTVNFNYRVKNNTKYHLGNLYIQLEDAKKEFEKKNFTYAVLKDIAIDLNKKSAQVEFMIEFLKYVSDAKRVDLFFDEDDPKKLVDFRAFDVNGKENDYPFSLYEKINLSKEEKDEILINMQDHASKLIRVPKKSWEIIDSLVLLANFF